MCKPYLLVVHYAGGLCEYQEHDGVGPAEVEGERILNTQPNAESFAVFSLLSRFKRVTRIESIPVKTPQMTAEVG